jgi:hypothetical protein
MTRPQPPEAPEGYVRVPTPDPEWRLDEGYCRRFVPKSEGSRATRPCAQPAVAALNRKRHNPHTGKRSDSWWRYCPDHMYGRWIEDGVVMYWKLERKS